MKLMFWKNGAEVERLKGESERNAKELFRSQDEVERLRKEIDKRDDLVAELERKLARTEEAAKFRGTLEVKVPEINAALAAVTEENPLWRAVHGFIAIQIAMEQDQVLGPGLSSESAHYNRGRLAGIVTIRDGLIEVWTKSRVRK